MKLFLRILFSVGLAASIAGVAVLLYVDSHNAEARIERTEINQLKGFAHRGNRPAERCQGSGDSQVARPG